MATLTAFAQRILLQDRETIALRKKYMDGIRGDSSTLKSNIKRSIANKLKEEFPEVDTSWLFKEAHNT